MASNATMIPAFHQARIAKPAPTGMRSPAKGSISVIIGEDANSQYGLPLQVFTKPDQAGRFQLIKDPYAESAPGFSRIGYEWTA